MSGGGNGGGESSSIEARPPGAEALPPLRLHGLLGSLLDDGLAVELRVTGASMWPFLRSGDLVTLIPPQRRPIRRGDVVAFLARRRWLVIHRVCAVGRRTLRCRGDATRRDDEPVVLQDVVGLVSRVERGGRRVRLGLGTERFLIAWLASRAWLVPLLRPVRWLVRR